MSESPSPPSGPEQAAGPNSSPLPGCIILLTIITVFGGLAVLYTVVAVLQNRSFAEFTDAEPAERAVLEPSEDQIRVANQKLEALMIASVENVMDRVLLTADDLNTLIATRELLADFRGMTHIRAISEKGIEAEMSQPVKTGIFGKGFRYLNATFYFKPELGNRTILFNVSDIKADNPERPVSEAFINGYSGLQFFKLDSSNPDLSPVLKKMSRVYIEGESVAVETRIEMPQ